MLGPLCVWALGDGRLALGSQVGGSVGRLRDGVPGLLVGGLLGALAYMGGAGALVGGAVGTLTYVGRAGTLVGGAIGARRVWLVGPLYGALAGRGWLSLVGYGGNGFGR